MPHEADVVDAQLELLVAKTLAEREQAGEDFARERDQVVFGEGALKKKARGSQILQSQFTFNLQMSTDEQGKAS